MDQVITTILPTKKRNIIKKTSSKGTIVIPITIVSFSGMHIHLGFQKLGSLKECQTLILLKKKNLTLQKSFVTIVMFHSSKT